MGLNRNVSTEELAKIKTMVQAAEQGKPVVLDNTGQLKELKNKPVQGDEPEPIMPNIGEFGSRG